MLTSRTVEQYLLAHFRKHTSTGSFSTLVDGHLQQSLQAARISCTASHGSDGDQLPRSPRTDNNQYPKCLITLKRQNKQEMKVNLHCLLSAILWGAWVLANEADLSVPSAQDRIELCCGSCRGKFSSVLCRYFRSARISFCVF